MTRQKNKWTSVKILTDSSGYPFNPIRTKSLRNPTQHELFALKKIIFQTYRAPNLLTKN